MSRVLWCVSPFGTVPARAKITPRIVKQLAKTIIIDWFPCFCDHAKIDTVCKSDRKEPNKVNDIVTHSVLDDLFGSVYHHKDVYLLLVSSHTQSFFGINL